jgi:hypothetical protein
MAVTYQGGDTGPSGAQAPEDWNTLKDDVSHMAGAAAERGRHFLDAAKDQATSYADQRKNDAAQSVADLAHSLRESCRVFEDRPHIGAFVESAAEGLDQLSETIRSRSFADIFNEVEGYMRRRPAAVGAATLAAGFLVARFIKASADNMRDEQQRATQGGQGTRSRPRASSQARSSGA